MYPAQIQITSTEHSRLLAIASKYEALCQNLIRGGVDHASIELLSQSSAIHENSHVSSDTPNHKPGRRFSTSTSTYTGTERWCPRPRNNGSYATGHSRDDYDDDDYDESADSCHSDEPSSLDPEDSASIAPRRSHYEQDGRRTVSLANLPPNTTHYDITGVVRGGPVVDIYLKIKENRATVIFVSGDHARKYLEYAQATGIHIHGFPITVTWNSRQSTLSPYVVRQLRGGASRYIVVRSPDRRVTADSIRDDLEHIHNLVVISVDFVGMDCYIGTNSVTAACFARTCMMSRYPYKGCRIEWGPDVCAQPLNQIRPSVKMPVQLPVESTPISLNRFSVLNLDD